MSISLLIDHECNGASQGSAEAQFADAVRSYLGASSAGVEANVTCGSLALLGHVFYTAAQASANPKYLALADDIASEPASFFTASNGWQLTSADAVAVVWVRDSNPASLHVGDQADIDPDSAMDFSPVLIACTVLALVLLGALLALTVYHGVFRAGRLRQIRKLAAQNRDSDGSVSFVKRRWRSGMRSDSDSDVVCSPMTSSSSANLAQNPARDIRLQVSIDSNSGIESGSSYPSDSQISTTTLSTSSMSSMEPDSVEPGLPLVTPV